MLKRLSVWNPSWKFSYGPSTPTPLWMELVSPPPFSTRLNSTKNGESWDKVPSQTQPMRSELYRLSLYLFLLGSWRWKTWPTASLRWGRCLCRTWRRRAPLTTGSMSLTRLECSALRDSNRSRQVKWKCILGISDKASAIFTISLFLLAFLCLSSLWLFVRWSVWLTNSLYTWQKTAGSLWLVWRLQTWDI